MTIMGFGLQHYNTTTGELYPNLWMSYCSEGEGWQSAHDKEQAMWFATYEEAQAQLAKSNTNVEIVPLEQPPVEITERRQTAWKLIRQAKAMWPYLSDYERRSHRLDEIPVEEAKIKPSLQVKLESDLATACAEIDRLHIELLAANQKQQLLDKLIVALKWYADPYPYDGQICGSEWVSPIELDKGKRAAEALAEVKKQ
jgi:hypothetical protein